MSGMRVRLKYLRRGLSHPGTHVAEREPSELCSSHSVRIPDRQDLVVRMSCCASSGRFIEEEKGELRFD